MDTFVPVQLFLWDLPVLLREEQQDWDWFFHSS